MHIPVGVGTQAYAGPHVHLYLNECKMKILIKANLSYEQRLLCVFMHQLLLEMLYNFHCRNISGL